MTHPVEAGSLRKGGYVMLKGKACKVLELTTSKSGKHGRAKAHIVGADIFTGRKYEDIYTTSETVAVPFVSRSEYQLVNLNSSSGTVSLLKEETGELRSDLDLPCFAAAAAGTGEP